MRINERGLHEFTRNEERMICEDYHSVYAYFTEYSPNDACACVAWGWRAPFGAIRQVLRRYGIMRRYDNGSEA